MTEVVILGAGHAGIQLSSSLRELGFEGAITVVHREPGWPYQRPPLSKSYLRGDMERGRFPLSSEDNFASKGIELLRGAAVFIDREHRFVWLDDGTPVHYDYLVLALGSRSRQMSVPGHGLAGVLSLRSLADADALRERLVDAKDVVVIGGGYIGLEFASNSGKPVTVLEARERLLARTSSPEIESFVSGLHTGHGVTIRTGVTVQAFQGDGQVASVSLSSGEQIPADIVVVAVGITPNSELAAKAGLAVDDGVLVDRHLTTEDPHVMAIGDCARFPYALSGDRVRLESVHNANNQARTAAAKIVGQSAVYSATPASWSEQFGARIQIAGLPSPNYTRAVWGDQDTDRFSVLSFDGSDTLAAVESVNNPAAHVAALRLLDGPARPTREQLRQFSFSVTDLVRSKGSQIAGSDVVSH